MMLRFAALALTCLSLALGAGRASASEDPAEWLQRMNEALATRNYDGSFFHLNDGKVESLRIIHRVEDGQVTERLMSLDGSGREFIRSGTELACYLPDQRTVLVERRSREGSLLGKLPVLDPSTAPFYDVRGGERTRLLGRPVRVVLVNPRDEYRYGYRLWIDEKTAMPLKTQMCDGRGNVVEQIVFASLRLPASIPDAAFEPAVATRGFRWIRHEARAAAAGRSGRAGWHAARLPPGFRMARRGLQVAPGAAEPTSHLVFSDGVAAVSVFVEPKPAAAAGEPGGTSGPGPARAAARVGSSTAITTVVDGHPVTVVGEVPARTIEVIASGLRADPAPSAPAAGFADVPRR
jgi:sigma-E factor negative regulatory protein RseB